MVHNSFRLAMLIALLIIFSSLIWSFNGNTQLSELAQFYTQKENIEDVNAANLVSAVIVTYRGFDTLGEVTILFLAASIIGFLLKKKLSDTESDQVRESSDLLLTASKILVPVMILFGIYVIINGHLTPGGGFQGGAIIASAMVLALMANPRMKFNRNLFNVLESISGVSFVLLGIAGIIYAGGFLDNRIFPAGELGSLLSAGAIPLIYIFIGLKVGSELSNIVGDLRITQSEK
jgi:multicomponent Na+:H+ antiporter subunit B